jgi:hypothetical protein
MAVGVDYHNVWLVTAAFGDLMGVCTWRLVQIIGSVERSKRRENFS